MYRRLVPVSLFLGLIFAFAPSANAQILSYVSDLISTSAPGTGATHTIQFTLARAVPPSGTITITPEGAFTLPAGFDLSDIALSAANNGPYVARTLASSASASADGVAITRGASPSITFTLGSVWGMDAGTAIRIVLASSTAPDNNPVNPISIGSYRIRIHTFDAAGTALDYGTAMIAVVAPVGVSGAVVQHAPDRSNGVPSGTIPAGNSIIEISLTTDEMATCRYATTTGIAYGAMTNTFASANDGTVFYTDLSGFKDNTSYAFYVRCMSAIGMANDDDYAIAFTLGPTPAVTTSGSSSGGSSGSTGSGPYPYGSSVLYLGTVAFQGVTSPRASVTILQDGVAATTAQADSGGNFNATIAGLERGTYTFGIYATDSQGRKTAADSETLGVGQGSTNTLSGLVLPPSISLSKNAVPVGTDVTVSGQAVPGAQMEISALDASGTAHTYAATSSPSGDTKGNWSAVIPGADLSQGSYFVKARAIQSVDSVSNFSTPAELDVGVTAPACSSQSDLNGDSKVNLVDFSIFLTHWGTKDSIGDFNCDGTVNLADFSIMLFNWTG